MSGPLAVGLLRTEGTSAEKPGEPLVAHFQIPLWTPLEVWAWLGRLRINDATMQELIKLHGRGAVRVLALQERARSLTAGPSPRPKRRRAVNLRVVR